jgi:hypothetical protein
MVKIKHLARRISGAAIVLLCGICPVFAAGWKILPGHVPQAALNLTAIGQLAATNQLRLAMGLPLRDEADLDRFLAQLYDPASPNFRHFLTPEAFTARFGPTEQDYEALKDFARTNGLTVTTTYGNRLVLDVAGPAQAVEKAFHITLRTYRHPTEARNFYAPDSEPVVDAALPLADIQGLSNFSRPRPRLHRMLRQKAVAKDGSAPDNSGAYFGNDFRNAYAPDATLTGAGQEVGLFEADGFYASDIASYAAAAGNGRANIPIQTVLVDNYNGVPTTGTNSGNPEVSLDIEMAMAMAPGLAKIVVVEGNPDYFVPNDILNEMLAESTVKNLSCSWGWSGGPSTTTDSIFRSMAAVGQSFFNAAGDGDAFTTGASSTNGVDNPALENTPSSSPYITQVGGTTLTTGAGGAYGSETVWNWGVEYGSSDDGIGSSGGSSSYYAIPAWQTNISNLAANGGSTVYRNIPDVALTADNVYVEYGDGSSAEFGGTSCATPLWAAFTAMVNEQAAAGGTASVGFVNPALYAIAAGPGYASCFHDVTTGNNTWSGSPGQFYAASGYDLCTGLGTPAGQNLINALAGMEALAVTPTSGAAAGVAGGPFSFSAGTFVLTNSGSASLDWSLVNPAAWLEVSAAGGSLAAGAETSLVCSLTATASNLPAGTYTADLTFSNLTANTAEAAEFTLQVSQPLVVSPTNGFAVSGPAGGPYTVTSQTYLLTNLSGSPLTWGASNGAAWLDVSPTGGLLAGGGETNVTVSVTAAADGLGYGVYPAEVLVTNFAGLAATLPFTLTSVNTNGPIVVNGGFEDGNFTGWTLNADAKYNFVTTSSGWVHSGSYGAALGQSSASPPGYLNQTLATSPGQNYLLSLWLANPKNHLGATPNEFIVQWNGTNVFDQSNLPSSGWTNLQFIVTATGSGTVLQFEFYDTPYYLALDDISVTPLPPPVFNLAQVQAAPSAAFNLAWSAVPGAAYQVQYKTNLVQTDWINLGGPVTAATNTLSISDTNALILSPSRFYRILLAP